MRPAPGARAGHFPLASGGQGCGEPLGGALTARLPLIGAKIEPAAAPAIRSAIRVESENGKAWLER